MFVSNELAASIESAEAALLDEILAGSKRRRPELDAWSERVAGACAGYAGPHAPANKISGLGFAGLPDAGQLAAIESRYHERKCAVVAEVATYADPALFSMLAERGYRLTAFEDVVGVALPARQGVQTTLVTERLVAATAAGCELAITVTQPGSKSQENMKRQGFELLFSRAVMVLPVR